MKRNLVVLLALAGGCSSSTYAPSTISLNIRNQVSRCVNFSIDGQKRVGQIAVAEVIASEVQPLAACGCRSKVLVYRLIERIGSGEESAELERVFGRVVLASRLSLVVATDVGLAGKVQRTLHCLHDLLHVANVEVVFSPWRGPPPFAHQRGYLRLDEGGRSAVFDGEEDMRDVAWLPTNRHGRCGTASTPSTRNRKYQRNQGPRSVAMREMSSVSRTGGEYV